MYTCKEAVDVLLEYLDGEMTPELKAKLEAHFSGCQPCEEFLAQYRATVGLCRKALEKRMPDSVSDRLKSFLKDNISSAKTG
jgi:anti-sigma factor RsiW